MNKRTASLLIGAGLLVLVSACSLWGGVPIGASADFNLGIESPQSGETLPLGPVEVVYYASSSAGIAQVELSINNTVVDSVSSGPGQPISVSDYQWMPAEAGNYSIRVRAQNARGLWSAYEEIQVTIAAPVLPTPVPTATPVPQPTAVPFRIQDVKADAFTFYYGDNSCGQRDITITARVNQPGVAYNMVLFTRLADQESTQTTKWDSGRAMTKISDDTYRLTLKAGDIANPDDYEFATLFYQIVATRENNSELDRTTIFKNVQFEICPQANMPANVRFINYSRNTDTFYYGGSTCGDKEVTITTDVTHPEKVEYVILFTRFKDRNSSDMTGWDGGTTMKVVDADSHRLTLQAENIDNYDAYDSARMSYQFIATDKNDKIVGRSLVFDDIILERCP